MGKLVGRTIVASRRFTQKEMEEIFWHIDEDLSSPIVLILDDGTQFFSVDNETSFRPGTIIGIAPNGDELVLDFTEEELYG